ncbi:hypothetical protein B0H14DRAFT_3614052 [Mycena olivaceomarginata]|nr:hypothetical protein B0H14DRAFT_3614052 [Mycena olivaceomarginata]
MLPTRINYKKTLAIYLFFEEVDSPANGVAVEGSQYFKCWLGNRVTIEIPSTARHNISKLKSHLEATSKAHYRLFQVLHARPSTEPATDVECGLAQGTVTMTPQLIAEYKNAADQIPGNVKELLEKQQAASKVPWDEEHFNDLVAKWVATCNQPFAAVNKPEFREMLQYAALHPADKPIVIPKREAVKARIHAMEKEMVEELSAIFLQDIRHGLGPPFVLQDGTQGMSLDEADYTPHTLRYDEPG